MLDIKFVRENKDKVKENIKKKFQDEKLPLVDEVVELDQRIRELKAKGDTLRQERNATSDEIGILFREKKTEEANAKKQRVVEINSQLQEIEKEENELSETLKSKMMVIPQIIDDSVPIGKDDSENVEIDTEKGTSSEWDEDMIRQLAHTVKVISAAHIRVYLNDGTEIEQEI